LRNADQIVNGKPIMQLLIDIHRNLKWMVKIEIVRDQAPRSDKQRFSCLVVGGTIG
jgi:hypothetical protein